MICCGKIRRVKAPAQTISSAETMLVCRGLGGDRASRAIAARNAGLTSIAQPLVSQWFPGCTGRGWGGCRLPPNRADGDIPPHDMAREINCPARFRDAVIFRKIVVAVALLPLGLVATAGYLLFLKEGIGAIWTRRRLARLDRANSHDPGDLDLPGAVSVRDQRREQLLLPPARPDPGIQQNRASRSAITHAAGMAYTPLTIFVFLGLTILGGLMLDSHMPVTAVGIVWCLAALPFGIELTALMHAPVLLVRLHAMRRRASVDAGDISSIFWFITAWMLLIALPLAIAITGIIALSLRQ